MQRLGPWHSFFSVVGSPLFSAVVVVILLLLGRTFSVPLWVEAACQVRNGAGQQLDLAKPLPSGVLYNAQRDELTCGQFKSCFAWTIATCRLVDCSLSQSCRNATLHDNQVVKCGASQACLDAKFVASHDVFCGSTGNNGGGNGPPQSCLHATIHSNTMISCQGAHACAWPPELAAAAEHQKRSDALSSGSNKKRRVIRPSLVAHVGLTGYIRCTHPTPTVDHSIHFNYTHTNNNVSAACRNMAVHVPNRKRACLAETGWLDDTPCAVACISPGSCDKKTIRFVLA